jgi:hypothetical protein
MAEAGLNIRSEFHSLLAEAPDAAQSLDGECRAVLENTGAAAIGIMLLDTPPRHGPARPGHPVF